MNLVEKLIALDRESPKRVMVVGDALVDRWVHGSLAECQDSCTKFVEEYSLTTTGGAANAAESLKHWRSKVTLVARYVESRFVKTRFVTDRVVFRYDSEKPSKVYPSDEYTRDLALANVKYADAVLLSDYDKGLLTERFLKQIISAAKLVVCDAKREPSLYAGAVLKCNTEYARKYRLLHPMHTVSNCVITGGEHSPIVMLETTTKKLDSRPPVQCVNHVGAGDCFGAHLALGLAHGLTLEEAASVAHSAGRVYVQHPHNRAPLPEEIMRDWG